MTASTPSGDAKRRSPSRVPETLPAVRVEDDTPVRVNNATFVMLEFDDPVFDTARMHPGAGKEDRIVLPETGTYLLTAEVQWEANDTGYRTLELMRLNHGAGAVGKSLVEPRDSSVQSTIQQVTALVRESEGTTVGLVAGQGSGVALDVVHATLSAAFLSP